MRRKKIACLFLTVIMALSMVTVTADASSSFTSKPANIKAKCVSAVAAKVSCKSVSGAAGYTFYVSSKKKGKYSLAADVKNNTTTITGLKTGKTYYFKVKAYSNTTPRKYSKFSSVVKCKITLKKPGLKIIDKCDCKTLLKMTGASGAKGFIVYRSTKKNKKYKKVGSTTGLTYLDSGLKKNTTYYYKIRAKSGKALSKYSKSKKVKTNKTGLGNGNSSAYSLANAGKSNYKNYLNGRKFLFLGSSITAGKCSGGTSFVEYVDKRNGSKSVKLAKSGTTLAKSKVANSYVERFSKWCKSKPTYYPDVLICQLSLNDAVIGVPCGSLKGIDFNKLTGDSASSYLGQLYSRTNTVAGAIEYITAYAYNKWPGCQVVFFTVRDVRQFKSYGQQYAEMRKMLFSAQKKYGKRAKDDTRNRIEIIDMWSNSSLTNLKGNTFFLYMNDVNHPKKAGYLKQWTPQFEKQLSLWLPTVYKVTWKYADEDGGEPIKVDNANKYSRLSYKGNTPKKAEDEEQVYTFIGWKDEKTDETGRVYTQTELQKLTVTDDVTYVAQFKSTPKTFTVTWKDEQGNVLLTSKSVIYGETIPDADRVEPPLKEGYDFKYWVDEANPDNPDYQYTMEELDKLLKEHHMTCNITFVAHYEKQSTEQGESSDGQTVNQPEEQNGEQLVEQNEAQE